MTFGENLQRLRNKAGLSQAGLADRSGISVNTIQNWEIGRHQPRLEALPKLAAALGVGVEALLTSDKGASAPARKQSRVRKGTE
jgi:transcriptional regulator with XRE-family HTH domain